jgi:tetratricopeptide (TPR) repeat protein
MFGDSLKTRFPDKLRLGRRPKPRKECLIEGLMDKRLSRLLAASVLMAVWAQTAYCDSQTVATHPPATGQSESPSTRDPAELFRLGKHALESNQLANAEEDFRQVIILDPQSSAAHINLGVTYMHEKRWDEAIGELNKAEALKSGEPGIDLNLGLAYYRKSDFSAAIGRFSAVLGKIPDSLQARYLLGLCYFFTNKYEQAAEALSPLWDKELTNLNYLYVLSIAASKSHDDALQKRAFDRMLAVGRGTPEFHLYIGKAWLAKDDTNSALKEFQAAAAAKSNLPTVHYFLGRTFLEQHNFAEAETEFQKDIAVEPDFAYNYEDLGILYAQTNQFDKAESAFRLAIQHNPALVNSWFGLAKLYRDAARYPEALDALDHAEALVPQSASLHYTRGQVLTRLGEKTKAQEEFAKSAKLLKSFNDRIQEDPSGDKTADAQDAAQQ